MRQAMPLFVVVFAVTCALGIRAQSSPQPLYSFAGNLSVDLQGFAVSGAGDVNGDGVPDFIVGIPGDDQIAPDAGAARVYSGATGALLYTFRGLVGGDNLGWAVAGAGDVNGDGFADLIVGAPRDDPNGRDSGSVRVYSGFDGSMLYNFQGDVTYNMLGMAVAKAGDVDGDGVPDIVAGGLGDATHTSLQGSVRVFSGATGAILHTFGGTSVVGLLGSSVDGAGDVDGDGFDDILAGAPTVMIPSLGTAGRVRVFSGATGTVLYTIPGSAVDGRFGNALASLDDVDGDGRPDFIVGSPTETSPTGDGAVRVFSGATGTLLYSMHGNTPGDVFGFAVDGLGDFNGDGVPDFAASQVHPFTSNSGSGSVQIFSGATGALLGVITGNAPDDLLGRSLSGVGDVDGDGLADLIVGAPIFNGIGPGVGQARVYVTGPVPHLEEPCSSGNVEVVPGSPVDLLFINGSAGAPTRIVDVNVFQPFVFEVAQPPTTLSPALFALGAFTGLPGPTDVTSLPGIGVTCLPVGLNSPGYFILTNNFNPMSPQATPSTPTPWSVTLSGLPFPFTLTVQGVIETQPGVIKVTNAVALRVR